MLNMNTYHCHVPVPLKSVQNLFGIPSEMISLVEMSVPCLDRREVPLMGVTEDVKVPVLALETHDTADGHVTLKPDGNILMTYFLVHLRFKGK